jgi:hypothetical protein
MTNEFDKLKEALDKIKPAEFKFKDEDTTEVIAEEIGADTVSVDSSTIDISGTWNGFPGFSIGATYAISGSNYVSAPVASGSMLSSNGASGYNWGNVTISSNPSLNVSGDAEFEGDIKWKGRSLGKLLESIEDRLAILQDPDPKKLEKHAALKKAYDHYKLLEKLIGDD